MLVQTCDSSNFSRNVAAIASTVALTLTRVLHHATLGSISFSFCRVSKEVNQNPTPEESSSLPAPGPFVWRRLTGQSVAEPQHCLIKPGLPMARGQLSDHSAMRRAPGPARTLTAARTLAAEAYRNQTGGIGAFIAHDAR